MRGCVVLRLQEIEAQWGACCLSQGTCTHYRLLGLRRGTAASLPAVFSISPVQPRKGRGTKDTYIQVKPTSQNFRGPYKRRSNVQLLACFRITSNQCSRWTAAPRAWQISLYQSSVVSSPSLHMVGMISDWAALSLRLQAWLFVEMHLICDMINAILSIAWLI